jgi:tripartite-type tricarboxylate transporter receptor subunit TctC
MRKLARRQFLRLASASALAPISPRAVWAQAYPSRPIKFIVPFPAGGTTDLLARILSQPLAEKLGQQIVVENKPGGGTNIAMSQAVNSPPDGYTLVMTLATSTINPSLYKSLPFDFARDIIPVSGLAELPLVIDMNKDVPAKNLAEFIAYCKANPGKVSFASFGARTISHLTIELLKHSSGIDVVHVPYPGGAPMLTDMITGRIQAGVDALPNSLPHIRSGAVRALAVMSPGRNPAVPDVPSASETIKGLEVSAWTGIGVPRGTPAEIVDRLNKEINAGLDSATVRNRYADVGAVPLLMSPAEAKKRVADDLVKWAQIVEQAGLKKE